MRRDLEATTKRYLEAVDDFVAKVRDDPNVIAVFLGGSLAYDQVWEKSDIDISVVVRDQALNERSYCIDEDDLALNVSLYTRSSFRQNLSKAKGGGITHSYYAKGRFIYTTDESLAEFVAEMRDLGSDDLDLSFFTASCFLLGLMEKVEKWLVVKEDPLYAQFYLLKCADLLATLYLCAHQELPSREAVLRVMELDPDFMLPFYQVPLSRTLSIAEVEESLVLMNRFLEEHLEMLIRPVRIHLSDGEQRTVTELCKFYHLDSHSITHIFDFLEQREVVGRASQAIRLTPKGKKAVEEVAYLYLKEE